MSRTGSKGYFIKTGFLVNVKYALGNNVHTFYLFGERNLVVTVKRNGRVLIYAGYVRIVHSGKAVEGCVAVHKYNVFVVNSTGDNVLVVDFKEERVVVLIEFTLKEVSASLEITIFTLFVKYVDSVAAAEHIDVTFYPNGNENDVFSRNETVRSNGSCNGSVVKVILNIVGFVYYVNVVNRTPTVEIISFARVFRGHGYFFTVNDGNDLILGKSRVLNAVGIVKLERYGDGSSVKVNAPFVVCNVGGNRKF